MKKNNKPFPIFPLMIFLPLLSLAQVKPIAQVDDYPVYKGKDLGLTYTRNKSQFKVWSPPAEAVKLRIFDTKTSFEPSLEVDMKKGKKGIWTAVLEGDLEGKFYTFQIKLKAQFTARELRDTTKDEFAPGNVLVTKTEGFEWLPQTPDPYAKATGANGTRAMVVDLTKTNPDGWASDKRPPLKSYADIILYEIHLRDISWHPESGIKMKGKYLGLTETGTKTPGGQSTGLDHLKELGITHVHILPAFDFLSLDETVESQKKYNWGYDPLNYNVPEGTYATDPYDGRVRIREFKQMVKALHDNGIRVILDVVYNHTGGKVEESVFNRMAPGYYYRKVPGLNGGSWSNASACGNETASERPMMRKYMLESMLHWVNEYHIDGFRVDLMGIHDIETMNLISKELRKIDPTIFIYGEGWTAGESTLPESLRAVKANVLKLDNIAAFSDEMRDGVKGHVFKPIAKGFATGEDGLEESVKFGIVGATQHPQINYKLVNYSKEPWAKSPLQCINYVSCHDNHTLFDRLKNSCPGESEEQLLQHAKFAQTIIFTSQGIPFLHAGEEFVRTKNGVENSFESSNEINQINWLNKEKYLDFFEYHKKLIRLRKEHPAFRMTDANMIAKHLEFLTFPMDNIVGYQLKNHANGDHWNRILLLFNGNTVGKKVDIPAGKWKMICKDGNLDVNGFGMITGTDVILSPRSALILVEE